MRLSALLDPELTVRDGDPAAIELTGLACDSREVRPGMLFAALTGSRHDGRRFVADAVTRGAVAALVDPAFAAAGHRPGVPLVVDADPRRRLALIAARWYRRQPDWIAAVTGTNGKTSVATFTRRLWTALGHQAAALGTLGLDAPARQVVTGLTTPDPIRLHALLAELAEAGVDRLVLEASSHGLDQHRLDGVRFGAAAFTNLSRDHFDYHGSAAGYLAAKRRLFSELLPAGGTAVLNADQAEFDQLAAVCRARDIEVLDYGARAERLRLLDRTARPDGQTILVHLDGYDHRITTGLVGAFQAANLLAAIGLVVASGIDGAAAIARAGEVRGAPGRLQRITGHPAGAEVYVDYAHTPDALAKVLAAVRPHTAGRLVVLFGCGGDRDPGKRIEMGRLASTHADRVLVTDDNPRTEDPAAIRRDVLRGCPDALEIGDRARAIRTALAELRAGDVLVVAGKGHESGQIVGTATLPFDDAAEVRAGIAELAGADP